MSYITTPIITNKLNIGPDQTHRPKKMSMGDKKKLASRMRLAIRAKVEQLVDANSITFQAWVANLVLVK